MPNAHKISIALTGEQISALEAAVETGEYSTPGEIILEALREWQFKRDLRAEEVQRLRQIWDQGKASGAMSPVQLAQVREQARRRLKSGRSTTHAN